MINNTSPTTNNPVNCSITAVDADPDTFTFYYKWYNSSITNDTVFTSSELTLTAPNWNKGNTVGCLALVNDGATNSSWFTSTTNGTITNTAPTVNVDTTFGNTSTNHSMITWADFSDADGDSDMTACKFFVQNTSGWGSEATTPTNGNCTTLLDYSIDGYIPKVDLSVIIQVYDDTYVNSTAGNNNLVNRLPALTTNPTINDTTPNIDVWLNCTAGAYADTDSDPKNKDYWRWYLSNAMMPNQINYTLNLSAVSETPNSTIFCSQKVYDSYDNSTWYNSSLATFALFGDDLIKKESDSTKKVSMNIVLDILTTAPISIYGEDTITVPIIIKNNGKYNLNNINLQAVPSTSDLTAVFANSIIPSLLVGEEFKTNLIITSHSTPGSYDIKIIADITSPRFTDTTRLVVDILERGLLNQTITVTKINFAKDLFEENPECIGLSSLLSKATRELENKNYERAREFTEAAVRKCRDLVSPIMVKEEVKPINYRLIAIIASIVISLILVALITYKLIKPK